MKKAPSVPENNTVTRANVTVTRRDGPGFLSPDKVSIDVLDELPEEIRNEIVSNLRKTGHIKKTKKIARMQTQSNVRVTSDVPSCSKNASLNSHIPDIVSPSQLDASFLRALPDEMREEILEESRSLKRRRIGVTKATGLNENPGNGSSAHDKDLDTRTTINEKDVIVVLSSSEDQSEVNSLKDTIQDGVIIDKSKPQSSEQSIRAGHQNQGNSSVLTEPKRLIQIMPNFYGATQCEDVKKLFRRWVQEHDGRLFFFSFSQILKLFLTDQTVEEKNIYFLRSSISETLTLTFSWTFGSFDQKTSGLNN